MRKAQSSVGGADEVFRLMGCEAYRLLSIFQSTGRDLPKYFNLQINPTCKVTLAYELTASCVYPTSAVEWHSSSGLLSPE